MTTNETTIDMGPGTYALPLSLFRDNRLRVCNALKEIPNAGDNNTFILLQGGDAINLYNTDVEYLFRQVSMKWMIFPFYTPKPIYGIAKCQNIHSFNESIDFLCAKFQEIHHIEMFIHRMTFLDTVFVCFLYIEKNTAEKKKWNDFSTKADLNEIKDWIGFMPLELLWFRFLEEFF